RVSVMTLALTGESYSQGQLQEAARAARLRLQGVTGVEQVSLHGVREEQIYIEILPARLAAAGISLEAVAKAIGDRNMVVSAGELDVSGRTLMLDASGQLKTASAV